MEHHVVIFDFDETMVLENSLGFLFKQLSGPFYWLRAVPVVVQSLVTLKFGHKLRRAVKQRLYSKILTGVSVKNIQMAGNAIAMKLTKNAPVIDQLIEAKKQGDIVIIATASPQIYVAAIVYAMGLEVDVVIGTNIDLKYGTIIGEECSREAKWLAVEEVLKTLSGNATTAFGNRPDDIYMLEQVDRGFVVSGDSIVRHKVN